jgi:FkbM family methyltransferase
MKRKSRIRFVRLFSSSISRLPRIKGLGVLIAWIANRYKDEDILIEKAVWGSRMRFRTNDLIGRVMIFSHNYYDHKERRLISQLVKKGDLVVDVGANIGIYTLFLRRLVGEDGKLVAIEAEENNVDELRRNLALNNASNVEVHHCGVSDRAEVLPLLLNTTGNAGGHSFFDQSHIGEPETQMVACLPLAAIMGDRRPSFMKLDIEGFEHRVLAQYFKDTNSAFWPDHIMLEDNPDRREQNAVELCVSRGYVIRQAIDYNVFLKLESPLE